jgi:gamma-glutamylcyclotransferase (GGCT)/AIG2-like uncharacterized protein YtfP
VSGTFHLFAYGTLRRDGAAADILNGCEWVAEATVPGILYDIDGRFPALVLYGDAPVCGDLWRCPAELLLRLDEYEGVATGLFRRVAREVQAGDEDVPAWIYAAGPALSRRLLAERRVSSGRWPASR